MCSFGGHCIHTDVHFGGHCTPTRTAVLHTPRAARAIPNLLHMHTLQHGQCMQTAACSAGCLLHDVHGCCAHSTPVADSCLPVAAACRVQGGREGQIRNPRQHHPTSILPCCTTSMRPHGHPGGTWDPVCHQRYSPSLADMALHTLCPHRPSPAARPTTRRPRSALLCLPTLFLLYTLFTPRVGQPPRSSSHSSPAGRGKPATMPCPKHNGGCPSTGFPPAPCSHPSPEPHPSVVPSGGDGGLHGITVLCRGWQ